MSLGNIVNFASNGVAAANTGGMSAIFGVTGGQGSDAKSLFQNVMKVVDFAMKTFGNTNDKVPNAGNQNNSSAMDQANKTPKERFESALKDLLKAIQQQDAQPTQTQDAKNKQDKKEMMNDFYNEMAQKIEDGLKKINQTDSPNNGISNQGMMIGFMSLNDLPAPSKGN
jgi:beta-mannanase